LQQDARGREREREKERERGRERESKRERERERERDRVQGAQKDQFTRQRVHFREGKYMCKYADHTFGPSPVNIENLINSLIEQGCDRFLEQMRMNIEKDNVIVKRRSYKLLC
jgi:hypothetical protein